MLIAHRYQFVGIIGRGGMGIVYQVFDRLTRQHIALKKVHNVSETDSPIAQSFSEDERLALTREFRIMASLHHPGIIEVLDYGFDNDQPFFTMPWLREPQTVVDYAQSLDFHGKMLLFSHLLGALQYLHKRGILHRDLKPSNVLVDQAQLHVLDFGLALDRDAPTGETGGTIFYQAPEVLGGQPPSIASDLYALGVILYEMLTGVYPFKALMNNLTSFTTRLQTTAPDLSILPPGLQMVAGRLLDKEPTRRYQDIRELMLALSIVLGWSIGQTQLGSQESSLASSRFVGRHAELTILGQALNEAIAGHGSLQLVGGESGVGKSRLLDELRIQALIRGVLVLVGQAQRDNTLPYQSWREPATRLALTTPMSDYEAGVLLELVPDLAELLRQPISAAPLLIDQTTPQHRLIEVVKALLLRQTQPVLLILEDLQWAMEGLVILQEVLDLLADRPILILGSYRSEARPQLPAALSIESPLLLDRLSIGETADLTRATLGDLPNMAEIEPLIERESAGNAFFVLEAIRALASAAGSFNKVATLQRPAAIFVEGIQTVLNQRLNRLESWAKQALALAAVMGCTVDTDVLANAMRHPSNLPLFLRLCSEFAVLEIRDGVWKFAHEKIHEVMLEWPSPAERPDLHQRVAIAIEAVYPGNATYATILFAHWQQVPDVPEKLIYYAPLAAGQMVRANRLPDAIAIYEAVIPLIPATEPDQRAAFIDTLDYWYRQLGC